MKNKTELHNMDDHELIHEILCLQKVIADMSINEASCSQIHRYHFASNEVIKLTKERYMASGFILGGIYSLSGKQIVQPLAISGGFSNSTINALLDDIDRTFNYKIELKPTTKRLN